MKTTEAIVELWWSCPYCDYDVTMITSVPYADGEYFEDECTMCKETFIVEVFPKQKEG